MIKGKAIVAVLTIAFSALAISACGDNGSSSPGSPTSTTPAPSGSISVPPEFAGKQQVVPVNIYAPFSYLGPDDQLTGASVDFSRAIGERLGFPVDVVEQAWENQLIGVQRGTYAWVIGAEITQERLASYDMVSWIGGHYTFAVLDSKPDIGTSMDDLCGLKIGAIAASSIIPTLEQQAEKCTTDGKEAMSVQTYSDQPTIQVALQSGRIDAGTLTASALGYAQELQPNVFKMTGPSYNESLIGIAVKKDSGLAPAIAEALNEMISDGQYNDILAKYGQTSIAIEKSETNPAPLGG